MPNPILFKLRRPTHRRGFGPLLVGTLGTVQSAVEYTATVSGGIQTGGTSASLKIKSATVSGGMQFAGSATLVKTKTAEVSGGVQFAGSGAWSWLKIAQSSGGKTLAGSAPNSITKAPPVSGGLALSGSASTGQVAERVYAGSGGMALAGSASFVSIKVPTVGGGLALSGSALAEGPVVESGGWSYYHNPYWKPAEEAKVFSFAGSGSLGITVSAKTEFATARSHMGAVALRSLRGSARTSAFDTYATARAEDEWLLAA